MHSDLTAKAAALCAEAKIIRKIEKRFRKQAQKALKKGRTDTASWMDENRTRQYTRRVTFVRHDARLTNIARGFLRGHSYCQIEKIVYNRLGTFDWSRVRGLVNTYGDRESPKWKVSMIDDFHTWLEEARNHCSNLSKNRKKKHKSDPEARLKYSQERKSLYVKD